MKIHEYQGKQLFRQAGVPVLDGVMAKTADDAVAAYDKLGNKIAVVKSQIHAGGRGKGTTKENPDQRGVVVCKNADEVRAAAEGLIGKTLVTIQTGEEGKEVHQVYVEAGCDIARELYLGIVVDRAAMKPVLMVSTEGGVEIETVAEETPELIFKEHFDPAVGLEGFQVRKLCKKLGITGAAAKAAAKFMPAICRFFVDFDCSMCEINPLVITGDDQVIALDAKIEFDSNALYRHPDLLPLRDETEDEPSEARASRSGLSFVKLEGNIGCLVNGAGLAMSTMDIIKYHGGQPANFLDVGGGANAEQVTEAFQILLGDPNCKGVLVNIFGGIARCTTIAAAIIEAGKTVGFEVPLVVRLEGTEVEEGRKMLAECDIDIINATDITDAAKKIVAATK
ncbi:Succinyl-CoA ligase [ADP-forming] subunit beta [Rubripirellula obstinata]|uniref:Succinate--CoA ligase [ADP-forming] subunit beta n=1 Tax=Rubripirellula obstinata TaxID=406547 RepID=A0A5B1CKT3_9BACT|nr:ADP-forming succinate--CoA ligase subunit beta [Rubripirellula obstinata]KAA1259934.1 Succinyl-CoA ligase [ADP-forming] subunit beta [Rubripirellula obstinata]